MPELLTIPETVATPLGSSVSATDELLQLCAIDDELFCRTFFPEDFTQKTPPFHRDVARLLDDQLNRYVAAMMFRGSAKTTKLRTYVAKRVAFGYSHTIAFVSLAQSHAITNLQWIKQKIEEGNGSRGSRLVQIFGLRPGAKWSEDHIEIINEALGQRINIVAKGMTGQIRGLNIGGKRPDLIVADDISDDETTATDVARDKANKLFFGSLARTLAPATENPDAKMVLLQTPLHPEDIVSVALQDPTWATMRVSCFDDNGNSVWPDRFPKESLLLEKESYVRKGLLRIWLAEMECTLVSGENTDFKAEWLRYWDQLPARMPMFLSIDPVPPPSERALAAGLKDNDFEVLSATGVGPNGYYLCEQSGSRGHDPEWTIMKFFEMVDRWKPLDVVVEGVAYQRTLKYILEKAMRERRRYVPIRILDDKRKKRHRIVQSVAGIASQGRLYIHPQHLDFHAQFLGFPHLGHDDYLDSAAMGLERAQQFDSSMLEEAFVEDAVAGPLELNWRQAP